MYHHPYELEINAAYTRERLMAFAEATRGSARSPRGEGPSGPALGWLRRGLGRRLIVAGERLAGSGVRPPAAAGPAV